MCTSFPACGFVLVGLKRNNNNNCNNNCSPFCAKIAEIAFVPWASFLFSFRMIKVKFGTVWRFQLTCKPAPITTGM